MSTVNFRVLTFRLDVSVTVGLPSLETLLKTVFSKAINEAIGARFEVLSAKMLKVWFFWYRLLSR